MNGKDTLVEIFNSETIEFIPPNKVMYSSIISESYCEMGFQESLPIIYGLLHENETIQNQNRKE